MFHRQMHADSNLTSAIFHLPIFQAEWVLWLLIVLSLLSVAIMLERWWFFRRRRIKVTEINQRLEGLLQVRDYEAAAAYLQPFDSLETNIALSGLKGQALGSKSVKELLAGAEAVEQLRFARGLSFLATVGSNAPFVGLFGTVLGIIRAFQDLAGNMSDASNTVMSGISEALVATAVGLLVAIPAVVAYNSLNGKVRTMTAQASLLCGTVLSQLGAEEA